MTLNIPQPSNFTNSMIDIIPINLVHTVSGTITQVSADFYGTVPTLLEVPAACAATAITFNVAYNETDTPQPLYVNGTVYSLTIASATAAKYYMNREYFRGVRFIQLVIGSSQSANMTFNIVPTLAA